MSSQAVTAAWLTLTPNPKEDLRDYVSAVALGASVASLRTGVCAQPYTGALHLRYHRFSPHRHREACALPPCPAADL